MRKIGHVDDLLIDDTEKKVRFLQVAAGGFLGLGERKFMIPVDAITLIDDKHVHVDQAREHIVGAPDYDPEVVPEQHHWNDLYSHYGYEPYWAGGYMYPAYPYYPTHSQAGLMEDGDNEYARHSGIDS